MKYYDLNLSVSDIAIQEFYMFDTDDTGERD